MFVEWINVLLWGNDTWIGMVCSSKQSLCGFSFYFTPFYQLGGVEVRRGTRGVMNSRSRTLWMLLWLLLFYYCYYYLFWGLNPGPGTCWTHTLSVSYTPIPNFKTYGKLLSSVLPFSFKLVKPFLLLCSLFFLLSLFLVVLCHQFFSTY